MAFTLGACGGDQGDATPDPSVTFATQPPPSGEPASTEPVTTGPADTDPATTGPAGTDPADTGTSDPVATLPPVQLETPAIALEQIGQFRQPVDLAWRAGDPTLYVVEQTGTVVPVRDGVAGQPVLDISDLTVGASEQGLLGLAFGPDDTHAYVNFTDRNGDTVIAEYEVGADGTFDEASQRVVMTIDQPYSNHNGGNVAFGPDAMLYIGMGDGGDGGDPQRLALDMSSLLGKLLRIDPTPSADAPYTVPADNPFVDVVGARPEIWSAGLRNPWRMSFDRVTGDLWIGDVGQGEIEEVDVAWAADGGGRGLNFGWSAFEGSNRYNSDQSAEGVTGPIWEYPHDGTECSVSGGAVYRGAAIPALAGWYVFGDYCSGNVYGLAIVDSEVVASAVLGHLESIDAVRQGPDGELYVISQVGPVSLILPG